ncbi:hypothetical protein GCM10026983_10800 [Gracilibacillus alcaliphilus]
MIMQISTAHGEKVIVKYIIYCYVKFDERVDTIDNISYGEQWIEMLEKKNKRGIE